MPKRNNDIAARIFGFILVLLGLAWMAFQMPHVQTGLAEKVVAKFEKKLGGNIEFSHIGIHPFNAITLSDVVITDKTPYIPDSTLYDCAPADTFISAEKISVSLSLKSLFKRGGIYINRAYVKNGMMHLVTEPTEDGKSTTNMARIFNMKPSNKPKTRGTANIFEARKVDVENFNFKMNNYATKQKYKGYGINWQDMDVHANVKGHNLKYTGGRMSGIADHIDLSEKSGYSCQELTGRAIVGMGKTSVSKLHLKDPWSDINIPLFEMNYDGTKDFSDFVNKVRMKLKVSDGTLSTNTLSGICGALHDKDLSLDLKNTEASGYVNDLNIKKLNFSEKNSGVSGSIEGSITGLPKTDNMLLDAKVNSLDFTTAGLSKLVRQVAPKAKVNLSKYAPGQKLRFNGTAKGPINNLNTTGTLSTPEGKVNVNARVSNLTNKRKPMEVVGHINTSGINAGKLAGVKGLENIALNSGFRATIDGANTNVSIDSVALNKLRFNGYEYKNIKLNGKYADGGFKGKLSSNDPNLDLDFDGELSFPSKKDPDSKGTYVFTADIRNADLKALNLYKREGLDKVSCKLNSNISTGKNGDLFGNVDISDLTLGNEKGSKNLGDATLRANSLDGQQTIVFNSGFADASYRGSRAISDLIKDIQTITTRKQLPALYSVKNPDEGHDDSYYNLILNTHDTRDLMSFVMPGLYIADSTRVALDIERDGSLRSSIVSSRLAWKTNYIKGVDITLDNEDNSINAILTSDEMSLANIGFQNSAFTAYAQNNNYFAGFHYDGIEGLENFGEIYLDGQLSRDLSDTLVVSAKPLSSYINFDGSRWDIDESEILYRAKEASIKGFKMYNENQSITIDGGISGSNSDTLRLNINEVDLSVMNYFTSKDYDFKGVTSGSALLSSPLKDMRAVLNLGCDSLHVSGQDAGSLKIAGIWDKSDGKISAFINNIIDGRDAIYANGSLDTKEKMVDAVINLDEMNPVLATPFISSILTDMSGGISGKITAKGPLNNLTLSGEGTRFNNSKARIVYTNVLYTLDGPFIIDENGITFDNINIYDEEDGRGVLYGGLKMRDFKNMSLDARLKLFSLMAVNKKSGTGFYGTLYASGNASATGPFNGITVDANLSTAKSGNVHVPLGGAASASESDLLTFTEHEEYYYDPYEDMLLTLNGDSKSAKKKSKGGIIVKGRVNINPEVEAVAELDTSGDNVLTAAGNGNISVDINTAASSFNVAGEYNIDHGKYHFSIPGIVSKDFSIDNGSSITMGGDIMESLLDIGATYSLRTSINNLISDTTSVGSRRTVNCGIHISDRLKSPSVSFSIDIPDLDPMIKSEVESALNTEDKVQKQFLALLITGSFISSEQSGVINNSNMLYSNMSEIMSRQLSNILGKLDIPVDLGVGYQQASSGQDIFDVNVSTQLFDNRVIVNGSFGNRKSNFVGGSSNSDMVGDIDIDIKLNKPGNLRLNLFSHSADEYSSYLDYSQRNGAGISYQREFGKWHQFWRSIKDRKKRKNQEMPPLERREESNVMIKLEGDDK